jgi:hypothetical protein
LGGKFAESLQELDVLVLLLLTILLQDATMESIIYELKIFPVELDPKITTGRDI